MLGHEPYTGAELAAHSSTGPVRGVKPRRPRAQCEAPPVVVHVNVAHLPSAEAAAQPELEVLCVGVRDGPPLDLTPCDRTPASADPHRLPGRPRRPPADRPAHRARIPRSRAGGTAVAAGLGGRPRSLAAAGIAARGLGDQGRLVDPSNEIPALWGRPPIVRVVIDGDLSPLPPA